MFSAPRYPCFAASDRRVPDPHRAVRRARPTGPPRGCGPAQAPRHARPERAILSGLDRDREAALSMAADAVGAHRHGSDRCPHPSSGIPARIGAGIDGRGVCPEMQGPGVGRGRRIQIIR